MGGVNPGGKVKTLREKYAEAYPNSPLTWINRDPWVEAFERRAAKIQAASLPILAVASPGIGLVVIRRRRGRSRRSRIGPGRIAGFVTLFASSAGLAGEFVMRRFDLQKYGRLHYGLGDVWIVIFLGTGVAILSAWFLLIVSGRWRRVRGWREWLGCGLGVAWLLALLWQLILEPLAQVYD